MDNQQPSTNTYIANKKPKKNHGFIYCYTSPSGKKYIGQTIQTLQERAKMNGKGYSRCGIFYKAIQKYGFEKFKVEILEEPLKELLDKKEQEWIAFLDTRAPNGYNITDGGNSHNIKKVYQYSCDGEFLQEFNSLTEAAKSINKSIQGISDCLHERKKASYGYIWSFEKKDQINPVKYILNEEKKVYSYSLNGDFVREYKSITEAANAVGANRCDIKKAINKKIRWSKGYQWSFEKVDKMPVITSGRNGGIKVIQKDIDTGEILAIFESQSEAAKKTGVSIKGISKACSGQQKTHGGFKWEICEGSTTKTSKLEGR